MKVVVIRGGIAAYCAAIGARREGADVTVLARAPGATALYAGGMEVMDDLDSVLKGQPHHPLTRLGLDSVRLSTELDTVIPALLLALEKDGLKFQGAWRTRGLYAVIHGIARPANLVPATVRVVAEDGVHLESPLGPLTVPRNGPCGEGQAVTLLLRPTAFSLWVRADVDRVPVTVRSTSFLGGVQRHHVEIGELRLVVDQPLGGVEELRSQMWLTVDPAAVYLLPAPAS